MCLRRAPEKYIAGAALDRADLTYQTRSLHHAMSLMTGLEVSIPSRQELIRMIKESTLCWKHL
jgi:hypothetical protein